MFSKRSTNYARLEGITHSELPAAIVFTVIYVPFFVFYLVRGLTRPTAVYWFLALFCQFRVAAFAMRAVLSGSETAGNNINLFVAQMVIYNVGFSGLLLSLFMLVLDRDKMTNATRQRARVLELIKHILYNRVVVHLAITAAIVIGIVGGVKQASIDNPSDVNLGNTLRKVSLYIFLVIVCLLVLFTVNLIFDERSAGVWDVKHASFGRRYGVMVLLLMSLLIIAREAYLAATTDNQAKQNKAAVWYPVVASTEFICVVLFTVPGLVPTKRDVNASEELDGQPASTQDTMTDIPLRHQRV